MAIISSQYRSAILALALVAAACTVEQSTAFMPASSVQTGRSNSAFVGPSLMTRSSASSIAKKSNSPFAAATATNRRSSTTSLSMSSDDFSEGKYTEAAWATISTLSKASDYYEATTIEAPLLVDVLLSPSKHGAGDGAESAKRVAEKILTAAGADVKVLRSDLEKYLAKQPKVSGGGGQKMMGRSLSKVLETARDSQRLLGDSFVSTEALLLALVKDEAQFLEGSLRRQSVLYKNVLEAVQKAREKSGPATSRGAENNYEALMKYGIDFTAQAAEGKLDPVIGRDDEIRRAIQVLSRRRKNNPVLVR